MNPSSSLQWVTIMQTPCFSLSGLISSLSQLHRVRWGGLQVVTCAPIGLERIIGDEITASSQTQHPSSHDGSIQLTTVIPSCRDFLLFMPAREHGSQLKAMLSFYDSVTHVTPEGDSLVSEDTLQGTGTAGTSTFRSLLHSLFGSMLRVAFPPGHPSGPAIPPQPSPNRTPSRGEATSPTSDESASPHGEMSTASQVSHASLSPEELDNPQTRQIPTHQNEEEHIAEAKNDSDGTLEHSGQHSTSSTETAKVKKTFALTTFIPHPGYFVAGAIAGGVSRTATAPLDRLKVYLLVNTSNQTVDFAALKQKRPGGIIKNAIRPIGDAVRDLFRSGGLKGFFAGTPVAHSSPEICIRAKD